GRKSTLAKDNRLITSSSGATLFVAVGDEATVLLAAVEEGDREAPGKLLELVYTELRRLAASKMAREAPGQTLQPTALVHEASPKALVREAGLRLVGANVKFETRAPFFPSPAEAMRRILTDGARRKLAQRHGGGHPQVDADAVEIAAPDQDQRLLDVHEVLDKF